MEVVARLRLWMPLYSMHLVLVVVWAMRDAHLVPPALSHSPWRARMVAVVCFVLVGVALGSPDIRVLFGRQHSLGAIPRDIGVGPRRCKWQEPCRVLAAKGCCILALMYMVQVFLAVVVCR